MGLLEFLEWCEDMKAEPVLAVYAGYSLKGMHVNPGPDLEPFVQEALEEIEYVCGDAKTTWGARRAKDGHPEPFKLTYVEIGNEDWFDKSKSYDERFAQFYDAIKAKYAKLKLISTIGNDQPESSHPHSRKPDMKDEHYYRSADEFIRMSPGYAKAYDRNGPEIFVGEWAAYETSFPPWDRRSKDEPPTPNLKTAIGDSAFMAAMERNSDLIKMQCYAPLLVNVNPGGRQWRPDMIGYDAMSAFGSPSYYAFQMFSRNVGDEMLSTASVETSVQGSPRVTAGRVKLFLKLVNPLATAQMISIEIAGITSLDSKGSAITLSGAADRTNSLDHPRNVVPSRPRCAICNRGLVTRSAEQHRGAQVQGPLINQKFEAKRADTSILQSEQNKSILSASPAKPRSSPVEARAGLGIVKCFVESGAKVISWAGAKTNCKRPAPPRPKRLCAGR